MKTPHVYIDTSVIGGVFDPEFQLFSEMFFQLAKDKKIRLMFSTLLTDELANAPLRVKAFYEELRQSCTIHNVIESAAADQLAKAYIHHKVVGATSLNDCLHIAMATAANADFLASWNFKHIVNVNRIRGYNSVNLTMGYSHLEIRNPREFVL
ncbi:MAG TPA: PIN domain-containing protein [Cyclobacteriaceae bacterium]|nr:PIN domain-containing protein [Cyclobacteriaceae bacterium]